MLSAPRLDRYEEIPTTSSTETNSTSRSLIYEGRLPKTKMLSDARTAGVLEAKKIIDLYEKRKEEHSVATSESIFNASDCRDHSMKILGSYNECGAEQIVLIDNYKQGMAGRQYSANEFDNVMASPITYESNKRFEIKEKHEAIVNTMIHVGQYRQIKENNDIGTQINSIFSNANKIPESRSIEIQHSQDDDRENLKYSRSEASVQCDIVKQNSLHKEVTVNCEPGIADREERLKKVIRQLIQKRRTSSGDSAFGKYIQKLREKHKRIGANNTSLMRDFDSNDVLPTMSSSRDMLSNSYSCHNVQSSSIMHKNSISYNVLPLDEEHRHRKTSPVHSQMNKTSRKRCSQYPPLLTDLYEYSNKRAINPVCYRSLMTNPTYVSHNTPKVRRLCRNIYSLPKPDQPIVYEQSTIQSNINFHPSIHSHDGSVHNDTIVKCETPQFPEFKLNIENLKFNKNPEIPNFGNVSTNKRETDERMKLLSPDFNVLKIDKNNVPVNKQEQGEMIKLLSPDFNMLKVHENIKQNECGEIAKSPLSENGETTVVSKPKPKSQNSLIEIEGKLDKLMKSIHLLMAEVKASKTFDQKSRSKTYIPHFNALNDDVITFGCANKINKTKSDPVRITNGTHILQSVGKMLVNNDIDLKGIFTPSDQKGCEIKFIVSSKTQTKSTNTVVSKPEVNITKDKDIKMIKEKSKHHKVSCDEYPHAVQITVDFLVKDPLTAVSQKKNNPNEDIKPTTSKALVSHASINTDPLSFHDISKETLKRLLSFFPLIEYYWSYLPFPKLFFSTYTPKIQCDVCKDTFRQISQYSDHRKIHSLEKKYNLNNDDKKPKGGTRTIKTVVQMPKLFTCKYCGQSFTRAYSKQLHEMSCKDNKNCSGQNSLIVLR